MDEKIAPHKGDFLSDEQAMKLAIQEAYKGAPFVSPNPLVGCVILDENSKFLSSGYHHKFGEPHAEVDAYTKLSDQELHNAQVFVTLEPCAHEGKTPSCAKALAKMPLKRVIFGLEDPNPLVAGQGAQIIRETGISCLEYDGELKSDLEDTCEVFLKNFREKKTFVAAKVAQSLDGQIALANGESKWITSEGSREFVHELRAWYDAVIVGRKTIETDNPSLNVRHPEIQKENYLIVIDPQGKILNSKKSYKFLEIHKKEKVIFAVQKDVTTDYKTLKFTDLDDLLNQLWNLKIKSVFVEGGARTYSGFLTAGLIDRLHVFTAPVIIGSGDGLSWSEYFSIPALEHKLVLKNVKHKTFSPDQYLTGRLMRD
ncbi:bifunctional diaminohydroxyphosphoribosylaminopyrimidine deaminase/5-amino-6-(5-phosphoribosylamino)uracil reductase RibD [Bdellovibrio sp. qaytius]|nr:bifunctional diaminohydroxyphosphoribosylaminopyrimidine deaminase/5-amino-6-(5-phosphoribosylamino)uracil reductase RibD [Bdellovibrio sp. qaytius]